MRVSCYGGGVGLLELSAEVLSVPAHPSEPSPVAYDLLEVSEAAQTPFCVGEGFPILPDAPHLFDPELCELYGTLEAHLNAEALALCEILESDELYEHLLGEWG